MLSQTLGCLLLFFYISQSAANVTYRFRQMDPSFFVDQSHSQDQGQSMRQSLYFKMLRTHVQGGSHDKQFQSPESTTDHMTRDVASQSAQIQNPSSKFLARPPNPAGPQNNEPQPASGPKMTGGPQNSPNQQTGSNTGPPLKDNGSNALPVNSDSINNNDIVYSNNKDEIENNNNKNVDVIHNNVLHQTVSGSMFSPGRSSNSVLQSPPGTNVNPNTVSSSSNNLPASSSNSQFGGNSNNMFGGNGLSVDASVFFNPRQNPDGSLSGAAGNAYGPPTLGPNAMMNSNYNNNYNSNDNSNNNNMFSGMFGPPNFFMNPGSSFGNDQ